MSTLTKVAIGVVLALLLALGAESVMVHRQTTKLAEQAAQMKDLNQKIKDVNKSIKTQDNVAKVTDTVVTAATTRITTNTQKGLAIKAVVDNVTKKVANENLSVNVASVAYTNSMWDAYCTAKPDDSTCTSRQPTY
jgi:mannitol-specific phosphotransferase system IIBC component